MSDWVPNMINWFIGAILLYIWNIIGMFLGLVGMWQIPLDAMISTVTSYKLPEMYKTYEDNMTVAM
eukprot:CAMPEP_0170478826 /NCGR_PEP_ID=MMETSP0208-20121228/276_1 /TAXON_ID=197538 /ORGANISM="Strombidium inclinatum, Strain S3" /LENGTH=65 /DNA_ID=CAMNT_0010751143 /DNA_START=11 /DNA_END=208 /DNA_ORIENTATION=+